MIIFSAKRFLLIIFAALFFVSLVFNVWLGYQLWMAVDAYEAQQTNTEVLDFTKMFVEDVLMADKEVDFDTRLTLETAVRNLNDQQIFDQWQKFVKSAAKEEASDQAKILLNLLVNKIRR